MCGIPWSCVRAEAIDPYGVFGALSWVKALRDYLLNDRYEGSSCVHVLRT